MALGLMPIKNLAVKPRLAGTMWQALFCGAIASQLAATSPEPGSRTVIVISDTHFGVGKVSGHWHNFEDARWPKEFASFLEHASETYDGKVDLIINGDMFELWQSLKKDCMMHSNRNLGCSRQESLDRLRRVLDEHESELQAIRAFADSRNRVVIVPGNHDAALLFDSVANSLVSGYKSHSFNCLKFT